MSSERPQRLRVVGRHGQRQQRQPHPQAAGLAQAERDRADLAGPVHRRDELRVGRQVGGDRPVGQVHAAAAGQPAPDLLGDERQQRRRHPGQDLEHRVERVERLVAGRRVAVPEPLPRPPDVPVGQHVEVLAHGLAGAGHVVLVHLRADVDDQVVRSWPAGSGRARRRWPSTTSRRSRQRWRTSEKKYQAFHSGSSTWRTPSRMPCSVTIRLPPRRIGEDIRNQRIASAPSRSKTSDDVRVVAQRLAHLLPVAAEHDAVAHAGLEGRPVEQRRRQHVQQVEPAAGLADVLDDEVARVVVLEPVAVLERVVHLGERHRAGVEPDVEHVLDPAHGRAPGRVVRVRPGQLVDVRPVQVGRPARRSRPPARPASRRRRPAGTPGRPTSTPGSGVPQKRLRLIDQSRALDSHLPNWPSLTCSGTQVISWLSSTIRSRNSVTSHEPARDGLVDQRVPAAPAVRVGVLVGLVPQQHGALGGRAGRLTRRTRLEVLDDLGVGLEDLQPGVVGDLAGEPAAVVDRHDGRDAVGLADRHVLLTEGRRLVHEPGAVVGA